MNNWLYRMERKYGHLGISHLMGYVVATMAVVYLVDILPGIQLNLTYWMGFHWGLVLQGQVWRLVTFIFLPATSNPIWIIFSLMFYYFIGNGLEQAWGKFSFTVYYVCGMLCTVVSGIILYYGMGGMLGSFMGNVYLNLTLLLAYACIYPDQQWRLYLFIPVKAKHVAIIDGVFLGIQLLLGTWTTRFAILAALFNFFLFFGPDFIRRLRNNQRYSSSRKQFRREMKNHNDIWR